MVGGGKGVDGHPYSATGVSCGKAAGLFQTLSQLENECSVCSLDRAETGNHKTSQAESQKGNWQGSQAGRPNR